MPLLARAFPARSYRRQRYTFRIAGYGFDQDAEGGRWQSTLLRVTNRRVTDPVAPRESLLGQPKLAEPQPEKVEGKARLAGIGVE